MKSKPKVVAVVGPTASGKTGLAIELAKKFSGEVISADSRQVYRDLDIGTGKVTEAEMQGVPHHLLDVAPLSEIYTGEAFLRDAKQAITTITSQNHLPIIAGGTFFYLELLRGTMQSAPVEPNQSFRESLNEYTNEELLELLRTKDTKRAETIDPHNRRRLVRALEIINTLGHIPEVQTVESEYDWLVIGIKAEKESLQAKFTARLEEWLDRGLLEEVERVQSEVSSERFMELGFEYTLVADYLAKRITKDELFEKFVQKNWQYAKRQMTWLKRDDTIIWFATIDTEKINAHVEQFLNTD